MAPPLLYTTGRNNGAELVSSLPMGDVPRIIFRVGPISLAANDVLHADGCAQYTTNELRKAVKGLPANTKISSKIILSTNLNATNGILVTDADSINVTPEIHHLPFPRSGWHQVTTPGSYYALLVSSADSSRGRKSLVVDYAYGWLDVAVFAANA
jgi:hypothetical protein